jgi:hypothetical protein
MPHDMSDLKRLRSAGLPTHIYPILVTYLQDILCAVCFDIYWHRICSAVVRVGTSPAMHIFAGTDRRL